MKGLKGRSFMNIELKQWNQDNKKELMKICNEADRTFLANRLPKPYTEKNAGFINQTPLPAVCWKKIRLL